MFAAPSPVCSIEETCEILGCGRTRIFQLLKEGALQSAPKIGRNLRIYRASIERLLFPTEQALRKNSQKAPAWDKSDIRL